MRCYICDYSDSTEARSMYHMSLVDPKGHKKRYVFYDKESQKEVCNYCYEPKVKT